MSEKIKRGIAVLIFGSAGSLVLGFIVFGSSIFNFGDMRSATIIFGIFASLFYAALKFGILQDQISVAAIIFILNISVHGNNISWNTLLRDTLMILGIFSALILYNIFVKAFKSIPIFVRALALPLFMGFCFGLAIFLLVVIYNLDIIGSMPVILMNIKIAAVIGLGIGLGFDLYEKFVGKFFKGI